MKKATQESLKSALREAPEMLRVAGPRGGKSTGKVLREGGDYGAGAILGYSVISEGEALGHNMWVDGEMLDQVVVAGNRKRGGLKGRFTHPGLSSDGMGKLLGRTKNFRREGGQVRADLHFVKSAHSTPDGDLAAYVMDLAEETPEDFGASIVFQRDAKAEVEFEKRNQNAEGNFVTPEPKNKRNLRHARVKDLLASDMVDEPAANPRGMFAAGPAGELVEGADALLLYAAGLSEAAPEGGEAVVGVHPERLRGFFGRFCERHSVVLMSKSELLAKVIRVGDIQVTEYSKLSEDEGTADTGLAENNTVEGEMELKDLTIEQLRQGRPDLVAALNKEGEDKGLKAGEDKGRKDGEQFGADAERKRCLGILKETRELAAGTAEGAPVLEMLGHGEKQIEAGAELAPATAELRKAKLEMLGKSGAPAVGTDAEKQKGGATEAMSAAAKRIQERRGK